MATWQGFFTEARRFLEIARGAAKLSYHSQTVSNAVHAVIAANDALCLYQTGERAQSDAHAEAARALTLACRGSALERQAPQRARQLLDVLQQKTASQYQGRQVDPATAERVLAQAERFIAWVGSALPAQGESPREAE